MSLRAAALAVCALGTAVPAARAAAPWQVRFEDDAGNACGPLRCTGPAGPALDALRARGARIAGCYGLPAPALRALRAEAGRRSGRTAPDLTQCFEIVPPDDTGGATALAALPGVLWAEQPTPLVPAQMPVPDFSARQTPLDDAPDGLSVRAFWNTTGVRGAGATVVDIELDVDDAHAELVRFARLRAGLGAGTPLWTDRDGQNHALASLGIVVAADDGRGTVGIAPLAQARFYSAYPREYTWGAGAAVLRVASAFGPATIVQLELQRPGPNYDAAADESGQFGMVPVEWSRADADALRAATALGLVVIEPAGNGFQDLDDPIYEGRLEPPVASGALVVCAGNPPSGDFGPARAAMFYSNTGRLCDLQGFGAEIVAPGYGDLYGADGTPDAYTAVFAGTSAATPQVTGAAALLQALAARAGGMLDADAMRAVLVSSGTPQAPGPHIGPLPNLVEAAPLAERLVGPLPAARNRGEWSLCHAAADCEAGLDCVDVLRGQRYCLPACEPFSVPEDPRCAPDARCTLQVWGGGLCVVGLGDGAPGSPCLDEASCGPNSYCGGEGGCQPLCSVSRQAGCQGGETCVAADQGVGDWGVCVWIEPNPLGTDDGAPCQEAADCRSGYCERGPAASLGLGDGVGVCATIGCTGNADCPTAGTRCVEPPTGALPECLRLCTEPSDCPGSAICAAGACFPPIPCLAETACPEGTRCGAEGLCEEGAAPPPAACSVDADCPAGRQCRDGACVAVAGGCLGDADCPNGARCRAGVCRAEASGCIFDAECAGDQICEAGACVAAPPICPAHQRPREGRCVPDGTCAVQADCPGRYECAAGRCVRAPTCAVDDDCRPARRCVAALCVPRACDGDADCGGGFACVAGACEARDAGAEPPDAWAARDGGIDASAGASADAGTATSPVGGRGCGCDLGGGGSKGPAAVLAALALALRPRRRVAGLTRPRKPSSAASDRRPPASQRARGRGPRR